MSDTSQGAGWWMASDGKWYPPELYPTDWTPPGASEPSADEQEQSAAEPDSGRSEDEPVVEVEAEPVEEIVAELPDVELPAVEEIVAELPDVEVVEAAAAAGIPDVEAVDTAGLADLPEAAVPEQVEVPEQVAPEGLHDLPEAAVPEQVEAPEQAAPPGLADLPEPAAPPPLTDRPEPAAPSPWGDDVDDATGWETDEPAVAAPPEPPAAAPVAPPAAPAAPPPAAPPAYAAAAATGYEATQVVPAVSETEAQQQAPDAWSTEGPPIAQSGPDVVAAPPAEASPLGPAIAGVGGAAMVVGSLLEWASPTIDTSVDIEGQLARLGLVGELNVPAIGALSSQSNSVGVLIAGLITLALSFLLFAKMRNMVVKIGLIVVGLFGAGLAAFSYLDLSDLKVTAGGQEIAGISFDIGIGLWIALAGGIVAAIGGLLSKTD